MEQAEEFWRTMGFATGWTFSDDPHSLPWAHMKKNDNASEYNKVVAALKDFGGAGGIWQLVESPKGEMAVHVYDPKLVARIKIVQEICKQSPDETISVLNLLKEKDRPVTGRAR